MPGFGKNAFSEVEDVAPPPVFGSCYRDISTTFDQTVLVTDEWVVVSALTVLPDAAAEVGLEHLGNFQFKNIGDTDKAVGMMWTGAASASALISNLSVSFCIGIWDGAAYIPQEDDIYPFSLQGTGVQAAQASSKIAKVFTPKTIPPGMHSAILCRRNQAGSNLRFLAGALSLYEVAL